MRIGRRDGEGKKVIQSFKWTGVRTHFRQEDGVHHGVVLEVLQDTHSFDLARRTVNIEFVQFPGIRLYMRRTCQFFALFCGFILFNKVKLLLFL